MVLDAGELCSLLRIALHASPNAGPGVLDCVCADACDMG